MSPDGNIYFHPDSVVYSDDLSLGDKWTQHLFIHEMTHVWQHQTGVPVAWRGIFEREYEYTLDTSKTLNEYSLEQQAQIVADYFLLKKFSTRAKFSRGNPVPSLADYEKVIPFKPVYK
jgi:Zn-dependent peptidase ImmA (M78 family)